MSTKNNLNQLKKKTVLKNSIDVKEKKTLTNVN